MWASIWSGRFWNGREVYSGYNDYNDVDLARLKQALHDIKNTADTHGAQMSVFLIPIAIDFSGCIRAARTGSDR